MHTLTSLKTAVHASEENLLIELRKLRRKERTAEALNVPDACKLTTGQKIADTVASTMGSWHFIIIQSIILLVWIILNITAYVKQWDPYPFILLNLALSCKLLMPRPSS